MTIQRDTVDVHVQPSILTVIIPLSNSLNITNGNVTRVNGTTFSLTVTYNALSSEATNQFFVINILPPSGNPYIRSTSLTRQIPDFRLNISGNLFLNDAASYVVAAIYCMLGNLDRNSPLFILEY